MKKILLILCLFPILVFSQKSYKIPADSTILNNIGSGKNELVIRNATSNITGGVLTNLGNGVTAFVLGGGSARVVDTIYKNNTKDSIVFTISGIRYAVKDSFNLNTDSQTLSISNDTLTISGGNSVILPVYIQIDSSTINSYDVLNSQNTPPISPNTGDVYLVGNVPTGAWVGQAKDIAEWSGSAWVFTDGVQGDFLYNATTALTYIFRSGNWVQTTGIPALNNGNSISSGLRIGTNNARSLTFETNNTNRGRFDSIGRFHVYNLPTSADTFVSVTDVNGKFGKVGKSSFLSGVNGSFIPLSGTVSGSPVTGDIEFNNLDELGNRKIFSTNNQEDVLEIKFSDEREIILNFEDTTQIVSQIKTGILGASLLSVTSTESISLEVAEGNVRIASSDRGIISDNDYSANITDLDYTQKIYVDNAISSNRKVDTSYIFRNATLDSTCMITVINGITYRSCAKDSVGSGTAYTFSTGLTNTSSTITNNLSTGVSGGQSVIGGTASGENLTFSSTSNATKGKILFGTSAYDEVNNRLGIGTTTPGNLLSIVGNSSTPGGVAFNIKNSNVSGDTRFSLSSSNNRTLNVQVTGDSYAVNQKGAYLFTNGGLSNMTFMTDGDVGSGGSGYISFATGGYDYSNERMRILANGNVGIGTTTPAASAKLEVSSTTSGFLPPRMTATQASAISSPAKGLILYSTDTNGTFTSAGLWMYNGTIWKLILAE